MQLTIDDQQLEQSVTEIMAKHNYFQPKANNRWLNKTNAAKYLNVSIPTFNAWLRKYGIPYSMVEGIRRFSKQDLDSFMERYRR